MHQLPPPHARVPRLATCQGCSQGVGVGLDPNNVVDQVWEGSPADTGGILLKDRVVLWNGAKLVDAEGKQIKLKDIVTPGDTHVLVVERVKNTEWKAQTSWAPKGNTWNGASKWNDDTPAS
jgi:S1-C subfamily serine protease